MSIKAVSTPSPALLDALVGGKGIPAAAILLLKFRPASKPVAVSFDVHIADKDENVLSTILEVRDELIEDLGVIGIADIDRAFTFTLSKA